MSVGKSRMDVRRAGWFAAYGAIVIGFFASAGLLIAQQVPGSSKSAANAGAGLPAGFQLLDRARMDQLQTLSLGAKLTLLALRGDPSIFDRDKSALWKFIDINNCSYDFRPPFRSAPPRLEVHPWGGNAAPAALQDEFQSSSILEAYKLRVPEVLNLVTDNSVVVRLDTYPEKNAFGSDVGRQLLLGSYDMEAKAFPFVKLDGTKVPSIKLSYAVLGVRGGTCENPFEFAFKIAFPVIELSKIPMDEQAARAYVADLTQRRGDRRLFLTVEVQILPDAPKFDPGPVVTFPVKVTRITATAQPFANTPGQSLGVLYP
jgi:hypothetical protein